MPSVDITVFDAVSGTTSEYSFQTSPVRIGRNPLNDLTLPFPFVSGWHAVVRFDETGAKFFDLGSTNGTLYNGRKIGAGEPIKVGDESLSVTIGKVELQIRRNTQQTAPPQQPSPLPPTPMQPGGFLPTGAFPSAQTAPGQPPGPWTPPSIADPGSYPQHGQGQPTPVRDSGSYSQPLPIHDSGSYPQPSVGQQPPGQMGTPAAPQPPPQRQHAKPGAAAGTIDSDRRRPAEQRGGEGVGEGTAHVEMSDVHQLVNRLRPIYQNFEQASQAMRAELTRALQPMPEHMHAFACSILARELPELAHTPEYQALQERSGLRPAKASAAGSAGELQAVAQLARSLRVDEEPPRSPEEAQRFLSCVEDVLRAAAKAVVELQKGQEQFGNEMGVRTIKEYTALHAAGTPENVLRYLLDWQSGGPHRTKELVGVYADLMIHQVALINGVMEGVRSLLARLAPEEIERNVGTAFGKASAAWKTYGERYRELCEEDRKITEAIFGPEFARAYAEVGGERG